VATIRAYGLRACCMSMCLLLLACFFSLQPAIVCN
jgi:hypothetical protein